MKRFTRIFVSLMLAIIMSTSLFMISACTEELPDMSGSAGTSASASVSGGGNSGGTQPGDNSGSGNSGSVNGGGDEQPQPGEAYQAEDRAAYTMQNMESVYMNASLYDVMTASQTDAGVASLLTGYRLGDLYNSAIDMMAAGAEDGGSFSPDTLKAFKFTRGLNDGKWHNAYTADVHPLLNKILDYALDGSGELGFTEAELETYSNTSILYLVKWSLNNSEIMVNGVKTDVGNAKVKELVEQILDGLVAQLGGMAGATLNAKLSDIDKMFGGDTQGVLNIYGALTMNELYGR